MNPLLLLVFLLSPIACHVSINYYAPDEAQLAAQQIVNVLQQAGTIGDFALFLSVFDQSFKAVFCGRTITYNDLARSGSIPATYGFQLELTSAVITGDMLTFVVVERIYQRQEVITFGARLIGGTYRIITENIVGHRCPPRRFLRAPRSEELYL